MVAPVMVDRTNMTEVTRYVTNDDLFNSGTTMIIPLNVEVLKLIEKIDSMDVNFSSINPINLLLTLNKTKPEMILFNQFSETVEPEWFQFHSAVYYTEVFIVLLLIFYAILIAIIIFVRIWRFHHNMLTTKNEKAMSKAKFHTIAGNIEQIRKLQTLRAGTENEQKLFNQVINFKDKLQNVNNELKNYFHRSTV